MHVRGDIHNKFRAAATSLAGTRLIRRADGSAAPSREYHRLSISRAPRFAPTDLRDSFLTVRAIKFQDFDHVGLRQISCKFYSLFMVYVE